MGFLTDLKIRTTPSRAREYLLADGDGLYLRVRATKSRDVREASFAERFDGATGGAVVDDPFNDDVRVNVSTVSGGNPKLRPEYADTHVVGFVYEPNWLEGLRFSADWYDVSEALEEPADFMLEAKEKDRALFALRAFARSADMADQPVL